MTIRKQLPGDRLVVRYHLWYCKVQVKYIEGQLSCRRLVYSQR